MAKVKVDLGVAEVIGKVKDTETINQADKTTALLIRAVHAALSPLNESEANTTRILYFRGVVSFVFNWKVFAEH